MPGTIHPLVRGITACIATAFFVTFVPAAVADEPEQLSPDCKDGGAPTKVGDGTGELIVGTSGDDVIYAGGGPDIVYGNGGDDKIFGDDGNDTLIGGDGQDALFGKPGDDTLVGDHGALSDGQRNDANGDVHKDCEVGGLGDDVLVGDNYAEMGDAHGGPNGVDSNGVDVLKGLADHDIVVGDNLAKRSYTASGSGTDFIAGSNNDDVAVVGDNYAPNGTATGASKDSVNTGPGDDFAVGDNYTESGTASGSGDDKGDGPDGVILGIGPWTDPEDVPGDGVPSRRDAGIHVQQGNDSAWGDNYARPDQGGSVSGGGDDSIGGYLGSDTLRGGPGNDQITGDCMDYPDPDHPNGPNINCWTQNENDDIFGGGGNDIMWGRYGVDLCDGGPPTAVEGGNDKADVRTGFSGSPSGRSCDSWPNTEVTFLGNAP
jgi:Ca2+-binding RTX toxin-like protein